MEKSQHYKSISGLDVKDSTDYFFFLVSFLAVIIFAMAPLILTVFLKLNPSNVSSPVSFETQLDSFAKIMVFLVILGALFGLLGTKIELSKTRTLRFFSKKIKMKQKLTLHLSTVVFLVAFLVEIYFVWLYVYL